MSSQMPTLSDRANDEVWAIGLDVGGTKIAGGLVRFPAGALVCRQTIPTRAERDAEAILADLSTLARSLFEQARSAGRTVVGVGLGVPELVNPEGRITSRQTINWCDISLPDRLDGMGVVRVEADVRAAALAEAQFGAGRLYQLFAYVTVGTGVSSTFVQRGEPYRGARGNALVLASSPNTTICPRCGTLVRTVLEEIASGSGLTRRYNQVRPGGAAGAEHVLALAQAGDADAIRIVQEAGEVLGSGVAFLVNVLDPEAVVVGGGLGLVSGPYWDAFLSSTRRHIWAEATRDLPIVKAELGTDAGIIGAAAAVWRNAGGPHAAT